MSLSYHSDDWPDGWTDGPGAGQSSLAPLLIVSALTLVALAGRTRIGAWLRGFFSAADPTIRRQLRQRLEIGLSPAQLRAMIVGQRKAFIASTFGPPRAAIHDPGPGPIAQTGFWRGDTWYYAMDQHMRTAIVVQFEDDVARDVELIAAPTIDT